MNDIPTTIKTLKRLIDIVNEHYAKLIDDSPNAQGSTWDMWESDAIIRIREIENVIQMLEDFEIAD